MDNYLLHRWPESAGRVAPPPPAPAPRKKRRGLRAVLWVLLAVVLLAGLAAGGWFLTGRLRRNWSFSWSSGGGLPMPTSPAQGEPAEEPAASMPRAEVGLGVTLELDDTLTESLTAREIYDLVLPSVVSVQARTPMGYGAGSGVIMREDGYVLTNCHVIKGASEVTVMLLEGGERCDAELVGYDEELDLAVLKIDGKGLTAARFGDSDTLRVGDVAYAIGNPMGYLYGTMTDGIISYVDRSQTIGGNEMTLIQTSAVLNSGNSGGALVNERGQVVGITVAKLSGVPTNIAAPQIEGLGFAIPISAARPFVNRILDAGESWRPVIGIMCRADTIDGRTGILVDSVTAGGPAEKAGMQAGDLILTANDRPVDTVYGLKRVLNDAGVGGTVRCAVLRDGKEMTLSVVLMDSADLPAS